MIAMLKNIKMNIPPAHYELFMFIKSSPRTSLPAAKNR